MSRINKFLISSMVGVFFIGAYLIYRYRFRGR